MYARTHYARVPYARSEGPVDITITGSPAAGEGHAPSGTTPLPVIVTGAAAFGHAFAPSADLQVILPGAVTFGHGYTPNGDPVFSGADLVVVGSPAFGHGNVPNGVTLADLRLGGWVLDLSQSWGFGLDALLDVSLEDETPAEGEDPVTGVPVDGARIQRVSETYPTPTLDDGRPV